MMPIHKDKISHDVWEKGQHIWRCQNMSSSHLKTWREWQHIWSHQDMRNSTIGGLLCAHLGPTISLSFINCLCSWSSSLGYAHDHVRKQAHVRNDHVRKQAHADANLDSRFESWEIMVLFHCKNALHLLHSRVSVSLSVHLSKAPINPSVCAFPSFSLSPSLSVCLCLCVFISPHNPIPPLCVHACMRTHICRHYVSMRLHSRLRLRRMIGSRRGQIRFTFVCENPDVCLSCEHVEKPVSVRESRACAKSSSLESPTQNQTVSWSCQHMWHWVCTKGHTTCLMLRKIIRKFSQCLQVVDATWGCNEYTDVFNTQKSSSKFPNHALSS